MNDTCAMLSCPVLITKRRLMVSSRLRSVTVATSRWYESRVTSGTSTPAPASSAKPIHPSRDGRAGAGGAGVGGRSPSGGTEQASGTDQEDGDHHQEPQDVDGGAAHEEG